MTNLDYEILRMYRSARSADQKPSQWSAGGYAHNELQRFIYKHSGALVPPEPDKTTLMGLPVVMDPDLPERLLALRAGEKQIETIVVSGDDTPKKSAPE